MPGSISKVLIANRGEISCRCVAVRAWPGSMRHACDMHALAVLCESTARHALRWRRRLCAAAKHGMRTCTARVPLRTARVPLLTPARRPARMMSAGRSAPPRSWASAAWRSSPSPTRSACTCCRRPRACAWAPRRRSTSMLRSSSRWPRRQVSASVPRAAGYVRPLLIWTAASHGLPAGRPPCVPSIRCAAQPTLSLLAQAAMPSSPATASSRRTPTSLRSAPPTASRSSAPPPVRCAARFRLLASRGWGVSGGAATILSLAACRRPHCRRHDEHVCAEAHGP